MRYFYYILFTLLALCSTLFVDNAEPVVSGDVCHYVVAESVDNAFSEELICCREYNCNMMLRTQRTITSVGNNNLTSSNNSVRSRNELHTKSLFQAIRESRVGHLTRIFEFNHFRSSLREVYYLYALCRLRI